jgi:hypothetical protein
MGKPGRNTNKGGGKVAYYMFCHHSHQSIHDGLARGMKYIKRLAHKSPNEQFIAIRHCRTNSLWG